MVVKFDLDMNILYKVETLKFKTSGSYSHTDISVADIFSVRD